MSDKAPDEPRDGSGGDDLGDLRLRDESDHQPSRLSTYGSPLFRVALLIALLAALVIFRKPCADGVAGFVGNFGQPAGQAVPRDAAARH
jgi:hypothetical protein